MLELAKRIIYNTRYYKKYTNLLNSSKVAGSDSLDEGKTYVHHNWTPPPVGWIKFNTNAAKSRLNQKTALIFVCRGITGRTIKKRMK